MVTCPQCAHRFHSPIDNDRPGLRLPLTKRQADVYRWTAEQIHVNGYAPSFEETAEHFGYRSLATVHEHLANLERKGWITRLFNERRAITCLVPVDEIGEQTSAGKP